MIIAITGTPGTGKTSISKLLEKKGFTVVDLNKIAVEKNFVLGYDKNRDSKIVDVVKLDRYVKKNYSKKDLIFVEGHLSHLLKCVDKVIVLRMHPSQLSKNLEKKGWKKNKIKENLEVELLDVILCEAVNIHSQNNVFEINATDESLDDLVEIIVKIIEKRFKNMKKYKIGKIDWSEELLKDFRL